MRINELTPEEHSIVKILRLMSDPDREWTMKNFWICAGVVIRQWSTPNDKVKDLKEMETGFAYEAFDKVTGAAQYTGLISYEDMLENPIRNPLACARVMAIQEIGFKGEVVSGVALRTLDQIKDARRAYRKEHREDPHDHSIRFITSNYD